MAEAALALDDSSWDEFLEEPVKKKAGRPKGRKNDQTLLREEIEWLRRIKLNPRQMLFVREYQKDHNGRRAAERSGYSPRYADSHASRLLSDPRIQKLIQLQEEDKAAVLDLTPERLILECAAMAFAPLDKCKPNDKLKAMELLMKVTGLIPEANSVKIENKVGATDTAPPTIQLVPTKNQETGEIIEAEILDAKEDTQRKEANAEATRSAP